MSSEGSTGSDQGEGAGHLPVRSMVLRRPWGGVCAVEEVKVLQRVKRWSRDRSVQKGRPLVVMMRILY